MAFRIATSVHPQSLGRPHSVGNRGGVNGYILSSDKRIYPDISEFRIEILSYPVLSIEIVSIRDISEDKRIRMMTSHVTFLVTSCKGNQYSMYDDRRPKASCNDETTRRHDNETMRCRATTRCKL